MRVMLRRKADLASLFASCRFIFIALWISPAVRARIRHGADTGLSRYLPYREPAVP